MDGFGDPEPLVHARSHMTQRAEYNEILRGDPEWENRTNHHHYLMPIPEKASSDVLGISIDGIRPILVEFHIPVLLKSWLKLAKQMI